MKPATTFVAEFVGTSNVIRGELAQQLSGNPQPFSIRPEHVRFAEGPLAATRSKSAACCTTSSTRAAPPL
jgi:putative spermidine/putrescine transport system ATP-binding protein